ncbi:hypothetical protein DY000_02010446 [Brassica cretica]|uniref:TCP domain-containing protein n=1 Tax=Brassica cretica TaxID=69181 RepID=A0ABQ7CGV3_BRACR|nr:hypothetical protein DY000_02010446 [Brassica cretica]
MILITQLTTHGEKRTDIAKFVQLKDRLGFDRPSKAVDWLIKKAKSAIDNLADTIPQAALNAKPKRPKTVIPPPATGIRGGSGEETEHHQLSFLPAYLSSGAPPRIIISHRQEPIHKAKNFLSCFTPSKRVLLSLIKQSMLCSLARAIR